MDESLHLIDDRFQSGGMEGEVFGRLQQPLQNLLAIKSFPPPILLDHHIRNLIDPLVRRETASAFQAFPAAADQITGTPFARIDHLVVAKRAERTFQPPLPPLARFPPPVPVTA